MKAKHLFFSMSIALALLFLPVSSFAGGGSGSGGGYNGEGGFHCVRFHGGFRGGGFWWGGRSWGGVGATLTGGARAIHILILIGVTAAVITAAVFTQAAMGERLREIAESVGVSWLPVV